MNKPPAFSGHSSSFRLSQCPRPAHRPPAVRKALTEGIAARGHRRKHLFFRLFHRLPCIVVAAMVASSPWPTTAQAVSIVVTLPPLAGLVRLLDAKPRVDCLLPPGADAHDFQLAPGQVRTLRRADLLVRAGRDDGHWRGLRARRTLDLWPETDHAWLLPTEVRKALPRLARALQSLEPDRRNIIEANLQQAVALTRDIEHRWQAALTPIAGRDAIMEHPAWRRLGERFGLTVPVVLEPHHHGGVRPRRLDEALRLARQRPNTLLWGDLRHDNRALEWLARRAGGRAVLKLDALGTCGMAWRALHRANIERLRAFLNAERGQ